MCLHRKRSHCVVSNAEICTHFISVKTSATEVKLQHTMQNGLTLCSKILFGNVASNQKNSDAFGILTRHLIRGTGLALNNRCVGESISQG